MALPSIRLTVVVRDGPDWSARSLGETAVTLQLQGDMTTDGVAGLTANAAGTAARSLLDEPIVARAVQQAIAAWQKENPAQAPALPADPFATA